MTYLQERKKLFEDKLADGYLDSELELEVKNLEAIGETFKELAGDDIEPPNSCACGGLKIHESDYCKDCV